MEVVFVDDVDPSSPRVGGITRYSSLLLEYLAKAGVKTTLLGVSYSNGRHHNDSGNVIPVINKAKYSGYEYLMKLIIKTPTLRIPESAIIHAQHPSYMLPFIMFHRKNPKVLTIHGQILNLIRLKRNKAIQFIYQKAETLVLRHSDIIIVVDEGTGIFYQEQYPFMVQPRLIPTGIDLTKFRLLDRNVLRPKYGLTSGDKVIAYVGRLEKEKGVDFLLDCFSLLTELVPEALITIVGDGRDRAYLQNMAIRLGLERVLFLGSQEPDTIPELLNCADVLALCSLNEGSPIVVKEALACGVPVVSTDVGDINHILKDSITGRTVSRNKEDFVNALADMLLYEDRDYVRKKCAASAMEYGFDRVGARIFDLYHDLTSDKK